MKRRHWVKNQQTETILGLALFAGGVVLLWDAYEGRGRRVPLMLRPVVPF